MFVMFILGPYGAGHKYMERQIDWTYFLVFFSLRIIKFARRKKQKYKSISNILYYILVANAIVIIIKQFKVIHCTINSVD